MIPTSARGKPGAGRRKSHREDDAPYTSSAGLLKRPAPNSERLDGEPRMKRAKRALDAPVSSHAHEDKPSVRVKLIPNVLFVDHDAQVDFRDLPIAALYRYMAHFDLLPPVYPSPLTAYDPLPANVLLDRPPLPQEQPRGLTPPASSTPANRPRRDPKLGGKDRRRSSRLGDDDELDGLARTPIQADTEDLHLVLASMCQSHFQDNPLSPVPREVEVLASFMCAVEKWKVGRDR